MPHSQKTFPKTPVIVLTGGGSGGHITPLLSLARALKAKNPNCNLVYIGHKGDKFAKGQTSFDDFDSVHTVNAGKFRRYHGESFFARITDVKTIFFNVRDFFRIAGSIAKAWRILKKVNPNVVFSKGGFVAVPVGIAAKVRGIPIVTHDSDAIPGLANRIIGRWAEVHATGLPAEFYDYPKAKTVYTGIPVDERIQPLGGAARQKLKQSIGVEPANQVLLVSGGGLGARDVNSKIVKIAPDLLKTNQKLYIIHQAGQANETEVAGQYSKVVDNTTRRRITVLGFTGELYKYICAADLIVGRAGASSVAEFAAARKACILIPNPFLANGHQLKNAQELQKIGAVEIVQDNAPPDELLGKIVTLLGSSSSRENLAGKLGKTAQPNAAAKLAEILLKIANE